MYSKEELRSMQALGLDFILEKDYFPNAKKLFLSDKYSVITASSPEQKAIVLIKTVMYPDDMNIHDKKRCIEIIGEICRSSGIAPDDYDFYFMGVGAFQKGVPEEQKRVFIIGKTYKIAFGNLFLLKKRSAEKYGYSSDAPIPLPSIPDEYYFVKEKIKPQNGIIVGCSRVCSCRGGNGHILDLWRVKIAKPIDWFTSVLCSVVELYLDPYCGGDIECMINADIDIEDFVVTDLFDGRRS